ncbi:MAG: hypothetical protein ACXAB4_13035 [Candidatus Hodarchaeales archaeon]
MLFVFLSSYRISIGVVIVITTSADFTAFSVVLREKKGGIGSLLCHVQHSGRPGLSATSAEASTPVNSRIILLVRSQLWDISDTETRFRESANLVRLIHSTCAPQLKASTKGRIIDPVAWLVHAGLT